MAEKFETGQVLTGKVTGIQPYGAFVALDEQVQGLVHISEVTHGFVKDINEHLSVGDEVKVKILDINEQSGKYSLSIRATEEAPAKQQQANVQKQAVSEDAPAGFNTLKDKLQDWIKQTEGK
ncbi:S1 domain-containing post-transcriptional regulator GSP13 [Terribacillus saccharophilus]|uniref:General stress protein n=2 Tax=Terribacillus saccharophilus TaxID=361277 RepID=A0A1H8E7K3_9BACI|nr:MULTISPECIES: S1 domain-containing post-transcriptional regulator GSP13 [Terribacillus]AIF68241.1 general stress protein [Terribacillus goriensis]MCM3226305.1 S1 domain-containing post-transcriptional regulator GSP13 [Terribacillus saccharophilus]MEC0282493.1 S1 domain-containing post-transcriptional regulator GSP13 [Terribacillus saccharophilus]MEC0288747.1 S1 domain-containing post-transcriptional regulator GSP13 [Terribacillus saccharophilus]MEC0301854.1 S1 domain-containing post-transcr